MLADDVEAFVEFVEVSYKIVSKYVYFVHIPKMVKVASGP